MIKLISYIQDASPNILYHWLKYYFDFLKVSSGHIFLHSSNKELTELCLNYIKKYDISVSIENKYSSKYKNEVISNYVKTLDYGSWCISPDLD